MDINEEIASKEEPLTTDWGPSECAPRELIGLFDLPEEIQEMILSLLTVRELVASARVSRSWRTGVNTSRVWKRWCSVETYKVANLERFANCHAEKADTDMGLWRRVYGGHEKLKTNWRNKSFNKYVLSEGDPVKVFCFDATPEVVAAGHEDSSIHVWSLKEKPRLIAKLSAVLPDLPVLSIKIEQSFIVAAQRKLLHVFHLQNGVYALTNLLSFELGQDNIDQTSEYSKLTSKFHSRYEECLRASDRALATGPLIYTIFENSLFTYSHQSGAVRIWSLPGAEGEVKDIHLEVTQISLDSKSVYLVGRDQLTYLLKYDAASSSFVSVLTVPGQKKVVVGDELIIALPSPGDVSLKRIWVYEKKNYSKPIATRTISGFSNVSLFSPHYVIYSEDASVTVWNPRKNSIVSTFATESVVSFLKPTFASFLLIFMNTSLYLWDWKTGQQLYRLYNGLEWTGNYANLLWSDAFTVLSGGVDYQLEMISYL